MSELDVAQERDVTVTEDVEDYFGEGRGPVRPAEPVASTVWPPSCAMIAHLGISQQSIEHGAARTAPR